MWDIVGSLIELIVGVVFFGFWGLILFMAVRIFLFPEKKRTISVEERKKLLDEQLKAGTIDKVTYQLRCHELTMSKEEFSDFVHALGHQRSKYDGSWDERYRDSDGDSRGRSGGSKYI